MKRKSLLVALLVLTALLSLFACKPEDSTIVSIAVKKKPDKTVYFLGDDVLDLSGGEIKVTYSDGRKSDIPMDNDGVKAGGFNTSVKGEVEITLTYLEKTTGFTIEVKDPELASIGVTPPDNLRYVVGAALDLRGGAVSLHYDDGNIINLSLEDKEVSVDYDFSQAGDAEVTVGYKGLTTNFIVEVLDVVSIEVLAAPSNVYYLIGETIDLSGGIVRLYGDEVTYLDLPMQSDRVSVNYNFSKIGEAQVTVSYQSVSRAFFVNVVAKRLVDISIFTFPAKRIYSMGENIALTNGIAKLNYHDGTSEYKALTDSSLTIEYDFSQSGFRSIVVRYRDRTTLFRVFIKGSVASLDNMQNLFALAADALNGQEYALYIYCYYQLVDLIEVIYSSGNIELIAAYEADYKSFFKDIENTFNSVFYNNYPEIKDGDLDYLLHAFADAAYTYLVGHDSTSDGFIIAMEDIFMTLGKLTATKQRIFFSVLYMDYYIYVSMASDYYGQYLNSSEISVYKLLLEAEIFYTFYISRGLYDNLLGFKSTMQNCITAYNNLDDATAFDNIFLKKYLDYLEIFKDIIIATEEVLEINDIVDLVYNNGIEHMGVTGDYTFFMIYTKLLDEKVKAMYARGDEDSIKGFEKILFDGQTLLDWYTEYYKIYDDVLKEYEEAGILDFYLEFMAKAEKYYNNLIQISSSLFCDRAAYPEFDDDFDALAEKLHSMTIEAQCVFLLKFDYSYANMLADHYQYVFETREEFDLAYNMYIAKLFYMTIEVLEPTSWTYFLFKTIMDESIKLYSGLTDTAAFDSSICGKEYAFYLEKYYEFFGKA